MQLLSLKDFCVLSISNYPAKAFKIPQEVIPQLYYGILQSNVMYDITTCVTCKRPRPCRHDNGYICIGRIQSGLRCSKSNKIGKKYCTFHNQLGICSKCQKPSINSKYSKHGLCWEHDREGRCIEKDHRGGLCRRKGTIKERCAFHQYFSPVPSLGSIEGTSRVYTDSTVTFKCQNPSDCPFTITSSGHSSYCQHCRGWRRYRTCPTLILCRNHVDSFNRNNGNYDDKKKREAIKRRNKYLKYSKLFS